MSPNEKISELITRDPITVTIDAPIPTAAAEMADNQIGDILVQDEGGQLVGILTDRDITVFAAQHPDLTETPVREALTRDVITLSSEATITEATEAMRQHAVRRLPVTGSGGELIGVISLGDLAEELDGSSVLGEISSAPASN